MLYAYYGGYLRRAQRGHRHHWQTRSATASRASSGSNNRAIQELTFGFNQTLWRNPRYGAINFMGQYEYLTRAPWYVASGSPKAAHDNTIYFNLRYTLPGSMPKF